MLIIAGLLLFYLVLSDKFYCLSGCLQCLAGPYVAGQVGGSFNPGVPGLGGSVEIPGLGSGDLEGGSVSGRKRGRIAGGSIGGGVNGSLPNIGGVVGF